MNPQRYRMQGVRYRTKEGTLYSIQGRPLNKEQINIQIRTIKLERVKEIRRRIIYLKKLRDAA